MGLTIHLRLGIAIHIMHLISRGENEVLMILVSGVPTGLIRNQHPTEVSSLILPPSLLPSVLSVSVIVSWSISF